MNGNFGENAVAEQTATEAVEKPVENKAPAKKAKTIKKNVYMKLFAVQQNLKAHKGQYNDFDNYNYRSAEDILEAVKPLLAEQEAIILINDEIYNFNNQIIKETRGGDNCKEVPCNYIKAVVKFIDCETGEELTATAYARECQHIGMSADQCTGCASSYARKYALNALLCIDNTADSDSNTVAELEEKAKAKQQGVKNNTQNNAQTSQPQKKGWGSPKASGWGNSK